MQARHQEARRPPPRRRAAPRPDFKVDPQTNAVSPLGGGFFAYDATFTGGVHVAVADVDGTGPAEIVTGAGPGGVTVAGGFFR